MRLGQGFVNFYPDEGTTHCVIYHKKDLFSLLALLNRKKESKIRKNKKKKKKIIVTNGIKSVILPN